ncbi:hypothetical protein [Chitinophaga japonensis]|uniref:Calx-beta domain-containing protein n=1 Tax=Chitinophaga japonensis TaxID=104662 RepID=A0A562TEP6_CHIJA|nr:hypothetical protein [Chitinophaga japonensis]TWI92017.1 hypothetical protein LX66_1398 [Chitinophaga japonensis]
MPIRSYLLACCALLLLTVTACKKKKGSGGDPAPQEELIKATLDGVAEGSYTASPGATYPFTINITSPLPASGVTIKVTATTDPGGVPVPQDTVPSPVKTATTTFTLTDLEPIRTVKVIVTIASVSNPNNQLIKEFWITNKSDE